MTSLSDDNQANIIEAFNSTSRYLDGLLNIDNPYFKEMVNQMYPPVLQLNKANTSYTEAPLLDLHLSISFGFVSCKIYDKGDNFDFDIVNFLFLDGDFPRRPSHGVIIYQLIKFARVYSHVEDFNARNKCLTAKLLKQGCLERLFPSYIADTMNWFKNSMSDQNIFYIKAYRNQNFMVT